ncbi:penicillin amidase [Andreprevotia lacus DSM 23236]|jgi:penicillin amidase|uniref:Penicillin amidase n=1 Tax=Andreprevotia lacus DSM 23236 TaxID=1121001 RepID=A0A1W1XQC8_9NEIS|nr:penicillin acylase family protein [Andreprevotia lacus]SMC25718.1 penicillin amidase [Andreprevotia lacus DSM 23236]
MKQSLARPRPLWWRILIGLLVLVLLVLAVAVIGGTVFLRGSQPVLDGSVASQGLQADVKIQRDAEGVPTVSGASREDVAYATGFLHAQERFFQMDLLRRSATGEISELLGPTAIAYDEGRRLHRFAARAEAAVAALPQADRKVLDRYVAGVNAGLDQLSNRPFEYALLGVAPRRWRAEDSLLVIWSMYFELQESQLHREFVRGWLRDQSTTAQQLDFLLPKSSEWDAPLDAPAIAEAAAPLPETAPGWFGRVATKQVAAVAMLSTVGSNNWALAGKRTAHGAAIIGTDMHLGLRLPHIWYRAVLAYPEAGKPVRMAGVTLPGVPSIVAGTNGHVAWGFTNSYGDYLDLVELEWDPKNPERYKVPNGWEAMTYHTEQIVVKGAQPDVLKVADSRFGPVWSVGGKRYAVRWVAHDKGAVNLGLLAMAQAQDVPAAVAAAQRLGIPAQNVVVGDSAGHIGWTIAGPLPGRHVPAGFPYRADAVDAGWQALAAPGQYPSVIDPASGQLWTANSRQLAGAEYSKIGDGGADLGARTRQLRDDLTGLGTTDEARAYLVMLDDRAVFMAPWRDRALRALDDKALAGHPQRAEFKRLLQTGWTGRADVGSVGYRLSKGYLNELYSRLFGALDEQLQKDDSQASFAVATSRWPTVIARLLEQRPQAWLPMGFNDWQAVELAAIDSTITKLTANGAPLSAATWGQRNTAHIGHPFIGAMPWLARWLAAPADQLAGDENMPRVAAPEFGQSERMVMSPSREAQAIFNMPGGQSGHPLSDYFLAGHATWVDGKAAPLLPGPQTHVLTLTAVRQ